MNEPAVNHALREYRRQLRIFMKRCNRIHRELAKRSRLSRGEIRYSGITSWSEDDQRWRNKKLAELKDMEKILPFSKAERKKRIQEIKDEILRDIEEQGGQAEPSN
jgi:hypothetical protein